MNILKINFVVLFIVLNISVLLDAKPYKGGELRTKESYLHGRFEARIKSTEAEGVLASFFTFYDGPDVFNNWNEIDIEIMGRYSDDVQFNTITPRQISHVSHSQVDFNPAADYHVYAFEWTPDYVAWFIDGKEYYRQTGGHITSLTKAQKIMMNIWSPENADWAGNWNDKVLPTFAHYDWVSYYEYKPGQGDYGSENNFSLLWKDEFESWDQSRWEKATHTFDGNRNDFSPSNVVFKNGEMILCLTDSFILGYSDNSTPKIEYSKVLFENIIMIKFYEAVTKESAENISNYKINGIEFTKAELRNDLKTIFLYTKETLDMNSSYTMEVSGIIDDSEKANAVVTQNVIVNSNEKISFPLKINVGGNAVGEYSADQRWIVSNNFGYLDGQQANYPASLAISGTDEDQIYRDERYGLVEYNFSLPNGIYNITFMMAEKYLSGQGQRVFDITVEGFTWLPNIDIIKSAGRNKAYNRSLNQIKVEDNELNIHFSGKVAIPIISGLVIEQVSVTNVENDEITPKGFSLKQNFPNPFNNTTKINFTLGKSQNVNLNIYNVLGKNIYSANLGFLNEGKHSVSWNGRAGSGNELSTGIYLYQIEGNGRSETKKMILMK